MRPTLEGRKNNKSWINASLLQMLANLATGSKAWSRATTMTRLLKIGVTPLVARMAGNPATRRMIPRVAQLRALLIALQKNKRRHKENKAVKRNSINLNNRQTKQLESWFLTRWQHPSTKTRKATRKDTSSTTIAREQVSRAKRMIFKLTEKDCLAKSVKHLTNL